MVKSFNDIISMAKKESTKKMTVAVANDTVILKGISEARELGLIEPILIGDEGDIKDIIDSLCLDLKNVQLIHEPDNERAAYKAIEMALTGEADIIMKGKMNTPQFMKVVLDKRMELRTERLISNVCLLDGPKYNRVLFLTDVVVNIAPDLEQKVEILENAIELTQALGIEIPKVAVLSAIELVTSDMPSTIDAACLVKMSQRGQIKAIVDGPFALDNVFSSESAEIKGIKSPVIEDVDILLAPNIDAANLLYKSMVQFGDFKGTGVFLGTKIPTVQTPRESPVEAKLVSIATTLLMLKKRKRTKEIKVKDKILKLA